MNQSSVAVITTNTTAGQPQVEIRTPSTTRARLQTLEVEATTATAQTLGIGFPAAIGVTPTSPTAFNRNDPGDPASLIVYALAWGTPPTAPTTFKRRFNGAAVIGNGFVWFSLGLIIPISSSIVLHNITSPAVNNVSMVIDE